MQELSVLQQLKDHADTVSLLFVEDNEHLREQSGVFFEKFFTLLIKEFPDRNIPLELAKLAPLSYFGTPGRLLLRCRAPPEQVRRLPVGGFRPHVRSRRPAHPGRGSWEMRQSGPAIRNWEAASARRRRSANAVAVRRSGQSLRARRASDRAHSGYSVSSRWPL